jgi:hypothetical protein|tara:strand:+ start:42500 stop:43336 length:837 start_codon:yes stop_codon:yes gene_type:complete
MLITKADGTKEPFDPSKLERSLARAGAVKEVRDYIVEHVKEEIREGMSTGEIYRQAFDLLKDKEKRPAVIFSMKRAVFELGPSGFPFERFVGKVFKNLDYKVENNVVLKGACIEHEVDIVASKPGECIGVEIKFHNRLGVKSDLKVALYVQARFTDLLGTKNRAGMCPVDQGSLITNTKFTYNAIKYGKCAGLRMVSWGYPEKGNLNDLIAEAGTYPITCLSSITDKEKKRLLEDGLVLCRTVVEKPDTLKSIGINDDRISEIIQEVKHLCGLNSRVQ